MCPDEPFWYEGRDLEVLAEMPRYYRWIMDFFFPYLDGPILEVGAGTGAISEHLLSHAAAVQLVEPSPNLVQRLEARFGHQPHLTIHAQTLERFLEAAPHDTYGAVVMVNVLEHIGEDAEALRGLATTLKSGGHILLFVPALPLLYSRLDRLVGHFRRYQRTAMEDLLASAGFEVVECRYMDFLGILPWWLTFTLAGRTAFHAKGARLYDRFGIPLTRAIESLVRVPVGKNLVAIARKPI